MTFEKYPMFKAAWLWILVVGLCASTGLAYPPDNAAVLYYKTCLEYQKPEGDVKKALREVAAGEAVPNQAMREYIEGQVHTIKNLTDAARIKGCDWGYDYSRGLNMVMAPLGDMRTLTRIVMADAVIHMDSGDWQGVLDHCSTAYGMARHIKTDSVLICHLVGIAMEGVANKVMTKMLAQMSLDTEGLTQANHLLERVATNNVGMQSCLAQETRMVTQYTSAPVLQAVINTSVGPDEKIPALDQTSFTRAMDYYRRQVGRLAEAFDLDYAQAIGAMETLEKQIQTDAGRLPKAKVAQALMPAVAKLLSAETRGRTEIHALRAAVGIYLARARQGRLPRQLPAGLPRDLFSGKEFAYRLTDGGFSLRCQGRDLGKDTVHEYPFRVAK